MARKLMGHLDRSLVLVLLSIVALGLYNLASASKPMGADLHVKQGVMIGLGVGVMALVMAVHYRNLEGLATPIFLTTVGLLALTSAFGKLVNGSRRWLVLGPVNIQTSDLAKLAVIVIVAKTFHTERWEGRLTLREILRPLNVSRPIIVLAIVILISIFGDALKPPTLKRRMKTRSRTVARLRAKSPEALIGKRRGKGKVRIPYSGVEHPHAKVTRIEDDHYVIENLSKEAGTFVNEERIQGTVRLQHNDVIRFGLNQRAVLTFSASITKLRPILPWIALFATLWVALAFFLQVRRGAWEYRDIVAPIDVVALPCLLILIQPDLGTTLVVLLIAFSMILYVGLRPGSLLALVTGGAAFGVVAWNFVLKQYQKERVLIFLNPKTDLTGAGYHQHQSLIAIGSGELWGKGHAAGTQTQLSFLPEQQTDFIFSVWAEEQGFFGCAVLVLLFAALILLSLRVAAQARDRFGALLAVGVTAMIFWHTIINMLMVLRLAPVVGVPLPLWSNGGSFVLTVMIGLGMLLNVGMRRNLF